MEIFIGIIIFVVVMVRKKHKSKRADSENTELILEHYRTKKSISPTEIITALKALRANELNSDVAKGLDLAIDKVNELDGGSTATESSSSDAGPTPTSRHYLGPNGGNQSFSKPSSFSVEEKHKPINTIDSVNFLLFAGAFLIVLSALFFIGSDQFNLDGWTKFGIISFLAFSFYASGAYLTSLNKKFAPAALTFLSIGIAVIPFLSFAYRSFIDTTITPGSAFMVYCMVLVAVVSFSYRFIKSVILDYVFIAGIIATVQSLMWNMDAPVYAHVWVGLSMSTLLLLFSQVISTKVNDFLKVTSLNFSYVGAAIFTALIPFQDTLDQIWMYGVSLMFVWSFMVVASFVLEDKHQKISSLNVSVIFPVLIALTITQAGSDYNFSVASLTLSILAAIYYVVDLVLIQSKFEHDAKFTLSISHFLALSIVTGLLFYLDMNLVPVALLSLVFFESILYYLSRNKDYLVMVLVGLVVMPLSLLKTDISDDNLIKMTSTYYMVLGGLILMTRYAFADKLSEHAKQAAIVTYTGVFGLSYVFSWFSDDKFTLLVSLFILPVIAAIDYIEKDSKIRQLTIPFSYMAAFFVGRYYDIEDSVAWAPFAVPAVAQKMYPILYEKEDNRVPWQVGALIGSSVTTTVAATYSLSLAGIIAIVSGLLSVLWGTKFNDKHATYIAIAKTAIGVSMILYSYDVRHILIYSAVWAGGIFAIAHLERPDDRKVSDSLYIAGLSALTLPLSFSIMIFDNSGSLDGLYLFLVNVSIFSIGLLAKYRNFISWGLVMIIANAIWQTRDYIQAIPKQFIGFGLGLAFVGFAIYLLAKKTKEED